MSFKSIVKKVKNVIMGNDVYSMATPEDRENQVRNDYEFAKQQREAQQLKWIKLNDYYNNKHDTKINLMKTAAEKGWNFVPPVTTDCYIQVEGQIDSVVPQAQFNGRDDDLDSARAKEREKVVEFICYNNKLKDMNTENERNLNKLGNAFWKVSFDGSIKAAGGQIGDIVIGNPNPANIFPDPAAYDIDDCEYIIYAFRMHKRKARRTFGKIVDDIGTDTSHEDTQIFDKSKTVDDDTVQIIEYWYRDDEGDIACSVQVNFTEVKHIEKYWENTRSSGNQSYPFIKYCKIPVEQSFWDKGEIETIVDLVDAADRELYVALLNDMFCANDVTVVEEHALKEGTEITNVPGSLITVKDNKINAVRRLGGVSNNNGILNMINYLHDKIEETTGNSSSTSGIEPTKVTTASGIAQLNERADARKNIKKADRTAGFERLYELIDWTALEFYNTNRIILINGEDDTKQASIFNSDNHLMRGLDGTPYYPRIDCEIVAGDGINKSKAFTLQATQELSKTNITPQNAPLVKEEIDLLDLPNKEDLKKDIDMSTQPQQIPQQGIDINSILSKLTPEEQQTFQSMPPEQQQQIISQLTGGNV